MNDRLTGQSTEERLAIVGSGAIACGLAAAAAGHAEVQLLARSDASADRARQNIEATCSKLGEKFDPGRVSMLTSIEELSQATFVVEAVIEDHDVKAELLDSLARVVGEETVLATTTSSLSIESLAQASTRPERFVGLHVFNPVAKMKLVELVFARQASEETRERARSLCRALEKTAIEVPDVPGFVVNRLLFPYLFGAVRLLEETRMDAADLDSCMRLGAGHPMGPLALLDLVGIDVAQAIGEELDETVPPLFERLIAEGALGRKSGRGFHAY